MLHPYPSTPEEAAVMATLLLKFKTCKVYSDRLSFWTTHDLNEYLYYVSFMSEGNTMLVEFLNKKLQCRTWEDALQLGILTLTPSNDVEAKEFAEWALSVRSGKNKYISTDEQLKQDFILRFEKVKRNREAFLAEEVKVASSWADDQVITSRAQRGNLGGVMDLDLTLFSDFIQKLNRGKEVNLATYIPLHRIEMNWKIVDTYLFAKAKYEYAIYLENYSSENVEVSNPTQAHKTDLKNNLPTPKIPNSSVTHAEAREIIKKILAPLSGLNMQKNYIMSNADYERLIDYTEQLVFENRMPEESKPFSQVGVSIEHIRYTFYRLHKELFGTRRISNHFITFLHQVFSQFAGYDLKTTKAKFSTPPKSYYNDFKVKSVK